MLKSIQHDNLKKNKLLNRLSYMVEVRSLPKVPKKILDAILAPLRLRILRRRVRLGKTNETSIVTIYDQHNNPIR